MRFVFDFGGVVFRWHPASFLARVWPHRIETLEQGAQVAAQFFHSLVVVASVQSPPFSW